MKIKIDEKTFRNSIKRMQIRLSDVTREMPEGSHKQMQEDVEEVGRAAQEYAPRDTGALEQSLRTNVSSNSYTTVGQVAFTVPYALVQHEMFPVKRKKGQMQYLTRAVMEYIKKYFESAQTTFKENIKRGLGNG